MTDMHKPLEYSKFLIGLDLGQKRDYTAVVVLRQWPRPDGAHYHLVHADRWRGRSYMDTVPIMRTILQQVDQLGLQEQRERTDLFAAPVDVELLVDYTGVGIAVVDNLRDAGLECIGVTITAGDAITRERDVVRVPKKELVSAVQLALQNRRLQIAGTLPHAETLINELQNFRATIKLNGHTSFGAGADWREANHDDLVLALAMALWRGEDRDRQRVDLTGTLDAINSLFQDRPPA